MLKKLQNLIDESFENFSKHDLLSKIIYSIGPIISLISIFVGAYIGDRLGHYLMFILHKIF